MANTYLAADAHPFLDDQRSAWTRTKALEAVNQDAQQRNERLANEVRDLEEGLGMVEELARNDLGMVRPNEIFVQIAHKKP